MFLKYGWGALKRIGDTLSSLEIVVVAAFAIIVLWLYQPPPATSLNVPDDLGLTHKGAR
jgi:hypothetical protein